MWGRVSGGRIFQGVGYLEVGYPREDRVSWKGYSRGRLSRGLYLSPPQVVATAAVSMYPTGILSCIIAMF